VSIQNKILWKISHDVRKRQASANRKLNFSCFMQSKVLDLYWADPGKTSSQ